MDLLLVDKKLNNSEYTTVDEFVSDVRLVFNNCFKYNGPEAMISVLCQNVESAFEKGLRQMPASHPSTPPHQHAVKKEPSPPLSQHSSPPPQQEYFAKPISEDTGRPKREIHCPSKDYPETYTTRHVQDTSMRFCTTALRELKKAKYRHLAYAFLQPVDPVALNIPDYFSIVKRPMDISTIENKLMNNAYKSPDEFEADVTLMFDNCYLYNPPSLPVYSMAKELQSVFKNKWTSRPAPPTKKTPVKQQHHEVTDDRDSKIAELERHLATITQQIESIKGAPKKKPTPVRRPSAPVKRKRVVKKRVASEDEEDEFSFEQKRELSELINNLSGDRLDTVVSIIQSSMPNLGGVSIVFCVIL
jgi:bromodomain-containing factor 1